MNSRLICTIILIIGVFVLPWWSTLFLGVYATIHFQWYYEIILIAFLFDTFYGPHSFIEFPYFGTLVAIALLLIFAHAKKGLRSQHI